MFYFVVAAIIIIGGAVGSVVVSGLETEKGKTGSVRLAGFSITAVLLIFYTIFASYHQVQAGHVGVVYQFGGIIGQRSEGLQWVAPWQDLTPASIQVQRHTFDKLDTFSKQTQDVFISATINVRVSPKAIQGLYRNIGPNWFDVLVTPRVNQFLKDETVKYDTTDIAPNREVLRADVRKRLNDVLASDSIDVVDFLINNISFRPEFIQAIEQKQIATQQALEQQQRVAVAKYTADQVRTKAQGEADATLILAMQQAKANDLLAKSITPTLIQYQTVQKLAPNVQTILLPSNQPFILGSDVLHQSK